MSGAPPSKPSATAATKTKYRRLRALERVSVLPDKYTERSRALTMLKRIETLEVRHSVKHDGHRYYVINVYFKLSQHHIPARCPSARRYRREPDLQIERRYSDFGNLSDEMYFHAHSGHGSTPCEFCSALIDYVTLGSSQPGVLVKLLYAEADICRVINRFMNHILQLTLQVKAYGGHECRGQNEIPVLLMRFILREESAVANDELRPVEGGWISISSVLSY